MSSTVPKRVKNSNAVCRIGGLDPKWKDKVNRGS